MTQMNIDFTHSTLLKSEDNDDLIKNIMALSHNHPILDNYSNIQSCYFFIQCIAQVLLEADLVPSMVTCSNRFMDSTLKSLNGHSIEKAMCNGHVIIDIKDHELSLITSFIQQGRDLPYAQCSVKSPDLPMFAKKPYHLFFNESIAEDSKSIFIRDIKLALTR